MIQELRDLIFIDIETVSQTNDYHSLDERLKVQWARKASFLKRDDAKTDEEMYHDRAAIYAEFGKIVCIAVGKFVDNEAGEPVFKTKAYCGHDEKALLNDFKSMTERLDPMTSKLCAHNGKEFDFPYLCRRMLVNDISLPGILNLAGKKSWEIPHIDTLEMWKFGDYKHYTSLDLLAAIFNIPSSKGDIDGSLVSKVYYQDNDVAKIRDYCVRDIVVLAKLYLKLKSISLSDAFAIQHAV